jgi:flagellar basal body-associated protein FliL
MSLIEQAEARARKESMGRLRKIALVILLIASVAAVIWLGRRVQHRPAAHAAAAVQLSPVRARPATPT